MGKQWENVTTFHPQQIHFWGCQKSYLSPVSRKWMETDWINHGTLLFHEGKLACKWVEGEDCNSSFDSGSPQIHHSIILSLESGMASPVWRVWAQEIRHTARQHGPQGRRKAHSNPLALPPLSWDKKIQNAEQIPLQSFKHAPVISNLGSWRVWEFGGERGAKDGWWVLRVAVSKMILYPLKNSPRQTWKSRRYN